MIFLISKYRRFNLRKFCVCGFFPHFLFYENVLLWSLIRKCTKKVLTNRLNYFSRAPYPLLHYFASASVQFE